MTVNRTKGHEGEQDTKTEQQLIKRAAQAGDIFGNHSVEDDEKGIT